MAIALIQAFSCQTGYVKLYRLVQLINCVVHSTDFSNETAIIGHERRHCLTQHGLDDIADVKNLAFSASEGNRRRSERRLIEIQRSRRARRFRAFGQKPRQHRGYPVQGEYKSSSQCQIECGVE